MSAATDHDTVTARSSDRAAWLRERRTGIGASEVAALVGRSPWASPWRVWVDKMGLAPLDAGDPNTSATFGRDLEPLIAAWFERETGLYVAGRQQLVRHPQHPHRFVTLDGLVGEGPLCESQHEPLGAELGLFESKYTADPPWADIPEHYRDQVTFGMHVCGLDHAWLAVMHLPFGRPLFRVYEVDRDPRRETELVTAADRFWHDHVLAGEPPELDGHPSTTEALTIAYPGEDAETGPPANAVDVADLEPVLAELAELKRARKQIAGDLERDGNTVRARLGTATEGTIGGQTVVSWRPQTETTIDVDAVRRDHGTRYDRTTTIRVLRQHTPKPRRRP
jgi:putative phage-type endonuclease